jgi:hypothetical protein
VAARSKVYVCCRSPTEIVGSNPTTDMDICRECCVLSGMGLCDELITRPEGTYRMWCVVVLFRNLVIEETMTHWGLSMAHWGLSMTHWGLSPQKQTNTLQTRVNVA